MDSETKLIFEEKGCTLSLTVGKYCININRYIRIWVMESPKTGSHSINTFSSRPDKRVLTHWQGFLTNQPIVK